MRSSPPSDGAATAFAGNGMILVFGIISGFWPIIVIAALLFVILVLAHLPAS